MKLRWLRLPRLLGLLCVFGPAYLAAHAEIRITNRILLQTTQVSPSESDSTYLLQVENLGADAANITAVATSFTSDATVEQGNLTFPNIPAGGTASSTNTYTIRHDSAVQVDQTLIRFAFSAISMPVADAGPDALITALNSNYASPRSKPFCCKLNARGSYDPFGMPLTYAWSVVSAPSGSAAGISSEGVVADFIPDLPGDYSIQLIVNNGHYDSAPSIVHLSTVAVAPKADAGLSHTIKPGEQVQLDGTHSVNPMNRPLTYAWSFVLAPDGIRPHLSDPTSPRPTFRVANAGMYTLQLIVTDGDRSSAPATVTYYSGNTPPNADAGPDLHIAANSYGFLSANRSTDSDGDFLTYRWVVLSSVCGATSVLPKLDPVPNPDFGPGGECFILWHVELFVNDGNSESISTQVVSSQWLEPPLPLGPYETILPAFATVDPPSAPRTVTLDGKLTQASDPLDGAYWTLREAPAGSTAKLNSNGMTATIAPDSNGLYIAQFQTDSQGFRNYPAAVSFLTTGGLPVANPGSTQFGLWTAPTPHTLNGSASWDPDGRALTYQWSLLSKPLGSNAALSSATDVSPTFTADVDGTYIFQLVVNDGVADSAPAVVSIISKDSAPVAENISIRFPWKSPCVPITLYGNDPLLDPYEYGYEILSLPSDGFLSPVPGGTGASTSLSTFPPASYGDVGVQGTPANNPEGQIGADTLCYVPFESVFTGFDSFTYAVWDDGYPSGCFTAGNYCIAPKKSVATATIQIFQD